MIMKIRNVNVGKTVTKVSPTVKAFKKRQGEVQTLSEWIAQQILFV